MLGADVPQHADVTHWSEGPTYFPLAHVPPGTYSRFYEVMERCNDIHITRAGVRTCLQMRVGDPHLGDISARMDMAGRKVWLGVVDRAHREAVKTWPGKYAPFRGYVAHDGSGVFAGLLGETARAFVQRWEDSPIDAYEHHGMATRCIWCSRQCHQRCLTAYSGAIIYVDRRPDVTSKSMDTLATLAVSDGEMVDPSCFRNLTDSLSSLPSGGLKDTCFK